MTRCQRSAPGVQGCDRYSRVGLRQRSVAGLPSSLNVATSAGLRWFAIRAWEADVNGTHFGRYRLVDLLGRGGMGEVWRAHDTAANNRLVAIKLLPPHLADDATYLTRFRREADAAARLNDPHIIPIHNYGEIDGRLYVDMRLVEGRDLEEVMSEGPMQPGRAVRIIEQVAKALHAAHQAGLVHRDVKPSNILLDADDFAYLIDFGIARAVDDSRLTEAGFAPGNAALHGPPGEAAGEPGRRGRPRRRLRTGVQPVRMRDGPAALQGGD